MTYSEKLKDPRWQRRRLEVLEAANWTCVDCGAKDKTLHVHHNFYRSKCDPWNYPDHAYRVICESCHEVAERDRKELQSCIESIYEAENGAGNLHVAIGMLKGLRMLNTLAVNPDHYERLANYQQAWGMARVFGGDERDLIAEIEHKSGVATDEDVSDLWIKQLERYTKRLEAQNEADSPGGDDLNDQAEAAGLPVDREMALAWNMVVEEIAKEHPLRSAFLYRATMAWEAGDILNVVFPAELKRVLNTPIAKQFARKIEKLWQSLTGRVVWCDYMLSAKPKEVLCA